MRVVLTGAGGYLGGRLADELLLPTCPLLVSTLLLTHHTKEPPSRADPRVTTLAIDLTSPGAATRLLRDCDVFLHLAATDSGHSEAEFEVGMRINLDATRALLEAARAKVTSGAPPILFMYASTCGVFGGTLPPIVREDTATKPQSSYGTAKAVCELLISDYTRRGYVDGRAVRVPTITVRAIAANRAVTSFASGLIREPLAGQESICPVGPEQAIWVASPAVTVRNFIHAATLAAGVLGPWPVVALPGLTVTVAEIVAALRAVGGDKAAALVRYERDETVARLVASFPVMFDDSRARSLGFMADENFTEIVRAYVRDDLCPLK